MSFLEENKLQLVCKSHYQESFDDFNIYSCTYSLINDDVWEFGQNESQSVLSNTEIELGVEKLLMEKKNVTICESSDDNRVWISSPKINIVAPWTARQK